MGHRTFFLGDSLSIMYPLWVIMLLRMSGWQRSSYPMPKSYYQSINQFMACDGFCVIVNETHATLLVLALTLAFP